MVEVLGAFCWHQKFVPKGFSALAPWLYTCIKSFKLKSYCKETVLKLAINGQSDKGFLLTSAFVPKGLSASALGLYTCIKALKCIPGPGVRWAIIGPLVLWFVLRIISRPRVKFVQWKTFKPPVVYTTDRSKAMVPMLFLFCAALYFALQCALCLALFFVYVLLLLFFFVVVVFLLLLLLLFFCCFFVFVFFLFCFFCFVFFVVLFFCFVFFLFLFFCPFSILISLLGEKGAGLCACRAFVC